MTSAWTPTIWAWGGTVELIQTMVAHKEHPIPSPTEEDPTPEVTQQTTPIIKTGRLLWETACCIKGV